MLDFMVVFLAGAVPISCALIIFGYSERSRSLLDLGRPAARGLLIFILAYLFYLLLRPVMQLEYSKEGLYVYHLLHDYLFFLVWCVVSYLIYYKVPHTDNPTDESLPILVYFTAFYTLPAVSDILMSKSLTAYILFLLPLCRVGIVLISVSAIILARRMYMVIRYGLLLIPLCVGTAAAFVPYLYTQKHAAGAIFLALGIFTVGGFMFIFSTRK
jgi:hypothetical protein